MARDMAQSQPHGVVILQMLKECGGEEGKGEKCDILDGILLSKFHSKQLTKGK